MRTFRADEKVAYDNITNQKTTFGVFHKTCIHVHTPESYDYTLISGWNAEEYKKASDTDIYEICLEKKVFPKLCSLKEIELTGKLNIFNNKKDLLSYLLLAQSLIDESIEIVIITDHHTIEGVKKLETAIEELSHFKTLPVYPEIILGIEISCADKNHVVGIFDNTDENKNQLYKWLSNNLVSKEEGSYQTSLIVLEYIKKIGGIGYIAHIDTSNTFKESFSGAYKKELFSKNKFNMIGLSDFSKKDDIKTKIRLISKKNFKYIIDNDSHNIDNLNQKHIWIKGSKKNFEMVKEAFNEYDISVSFEKEQENKQYIKGLYIENDEGFLKGKNNEPAFCVVFSSALNCFIGGRGAGKSSSLKILELILGQRCLNKKELEFLCLHGNTWIVYVIDNVEYLIGLRLPIKEHPEDNILNYFGHNYSDTSRNKNNIDQEIMKNFIYSDLEISKIIVVNGIKNLEKVSDKKTFLRKCFDAKYSVNELVNTASGSEINEFIEKTLFENNKLTNPASVINIRNKNDLAKKLKVIKEKLEEREKRVNETIDPFNISQKGKFKIQYSQNKQAETQADCFKWLTSSEDIGNGWYKNYNISTKNISDYLLSLKDCLGIWDFFNMILENDIEKAKSEIDILEYCTDLTQRMVDKNIEKLDINNIDFLIQDVFLNLITDKNISFVQTFLKKYVTEIEEFSLYFNINNREGNNAKDLFKDVRDISLGQKVVAMLSFILGYSDYSCDYRPLVIDQPEDNLDNQYIYKNLVQQLRNIKEKRQIIIATHNATIVTNAKADQVCVMESDNQHGWIAMTGYPGERKIKNQIINYLEGGKKSFLHKQQIYSDVLNNE